MIIPSPTKSLKVHSCNPSVVKNTFISLPCFGTSFERNAKLLKPYSIHFAFSTVCQPRNLLFKFKPKTSPLDLLGVAYFIPDLFLEKSVRGIFTPYLRHLRTKCRINRTIRLGLSLYTDRHIHRQTLFFIIIRDYR